MSRYVIGFLFSEDFSSVALIRKPALTMGLFNAPGGRVEAGESDYSAMVREFREETGVEHSGWKRFASVGNDEEEDSDGFYRMTCFYGVSDGVYQAKSVTDEEVKVFYIKNLLDSHWAEQLVFNLPWLLHMGLAIADGRDQSAGYVVRHDWGA